MKIAYLTLLSLAAAACSSAETGGPKNDVVKDADGSEPAATEPKAPEDTRPFLAENLAIREVALFQGVRVSIAAEDPATHALGRVKELNAPLVAQRPGLLRAYVDAKPGWKRQAVRCELQLVATEGAIETLTERKTFETDSTEEDLESTCNFSLTEKQLTAGMAYSVRIIDEQKGVRADSSPAMYPNDGQAEAFRVKKVGALKIVLVPVQYTADRSNRLPDTSPAAIEKFRTTMSALYPVQSVDITMHEPMAWDETITGSDGLGELLRGILSLRATEAPDENVFYYGLVAPASTSQAYCPPGSSCTGGVTLKRDGLQPAELRGSVGISLTIGEMTPEIVMAHELGHAHGRNHAPCGPVAGADEEFPYAKGATGVWGYDLRSRKLMKPTSTDFMGYCDKRWTSDYTYAALAEEVIRVNQPAPAAAPVSEGASQSLPRYRWVTVANGTARFGAPITLRSAPEGTPRSANYHGRNGESRVGTSFFYSFHDVAGGMYLVEDGDYDAVEITDAASTLTLTR